MKQAWLSCIGVAMMATSAAHAYTTAECANCAQWNTPYKPFRIFGNTYYVGVQGLSSILITGAQGHVLIDGDLPESAALIETNIRALGFRIEDIKLILNSHAHFDHAGGIAELQRLSGATVWASPYSAEVLTTGMAGRSDPQYDIALAFPKVKQPKVLRDGQTLTLGKLQLAAHFTPGHTPGGTTWTWQSCEQTQCKQIVYADSLSVVSADGFRFSDSQNYPMAVSDFEHAFSVLEMLPCDLLLTPHPDVSGMWSRLPLSKQSQQSNVYAGADACRQYIATARGKLQIRLQKERAQ